MENSNQNITLELHDTHLYYFYGTNYLGLLTFGGQLSDFRATVRKNSWKLSKENIEKHIRMGLYELLNHYLYEKLYMDQPDIQENKKKIVESAKAVIQDVTNEIRKKGLL
jgi:hypothetical protein